MNSDLKFTLEETVENHRKLWRKIAELSKDKQYIDSIVGEPKNIVVKRDAIEDVFGGVYKPGEIIGNCFMCHYTLNRCPLCPMYNLKHLDKSCLNGRYDDFTAALYDRDLEEASRIALEIAYLPIVNVSKDK